MTGLTLEPILRHADPCAASATCIAVSGCRRTTTLFARRMPRIVDLATPLAAMMLCGAGELVPGGPTRTDLPQIRRPHPCWRIGGTEVDELDGAVVLIAVQETGCRRPIVMRANARVLRVVRTAPTWKLGRRRASLCRARNLPTVRKLPSLMAGVSHHPLKRENPRDSGGFEVLHQWAIPDSN